MKDREPRPLSPVLLECGSDDGAIEAKISNDTADTFTGIDNGNKPPILHRARDHRRAIAGLVLVAVGAAIAVSVALAKQNDTSRGGTSSGASANSNSGFFAEDNYTSSSTFGILGGDNDDLWILDEQQEETEDNPRPTRRPSTPRPTRRPTPTPSKRPVNEPTKQKQSVLDLLYELSTDANAEKEVEKMEQEAQQQQQQNEKVTLNRPNVLFLPIDDLNNWIGYMDKNPQSKTPNFDRLSAMGVSFTNAHAASTICNPSRAATWSGIRPGTSGCYQNQDEPWTRFIAEGLNINAHFKKNGWYTAARGKTYHSSKGGFHKADEKKTVYTSEWHEYPKTEKKPDPIPNHLDGFTQPWLSAPNYKDDDDPDWYTVEFCIDQLNQFEERDDPTFLACGLIKPHLPWAVPQKYYDMYPRWEIDVPPSPDDDLDDVPEMGWKMASPEKEDANVTKLNRQRDAVQGYLASIRYADMNLGRLLDAFEALPKSERDNTIIVLWSDHGYHLGQKRHWKKATLWEEASEVPYIWVVPGLTTPGTICERPVDLMSIYPTLCDLAGLDVPNHVEGANIRSLLEDPDAKWDDKALTTMGYANHAVIDERYRYIRYEDGTEELYDHDRDPDEYTNRAGWGGQYNSIKEELSAWLPKNNMRKWGLDQTCTDLYDADDFVKKCDDGSFVARDPNDSCDFVSCPR